jgi:small subunit ribosomal protein S17
MARTIIGTVSSNKTDKTIVVTVKESKTHPLYRKKYATSKKFMAHDENNEAQPGDKVAIVETRPISRHKSHKLDRIIERAAITHVEPEESKKAKAEASASDEPSAKATERSAK